MLNYNFLLKKNNKAQIGESLTWIVATLVIVLVLVIFIYVASTMGKAKSISQEKISLKTSSGVEETNWINMKTFFAKEIDNRNSEKIDSWISKEGIENESG